MPLRFCSSILFLIKPFLVIMSQFSTFIMTTLLAPKFALTLSRNLKTLWVVLASVSHFNLDFFQEVREICVSCKPHNPSTPLAIIYVEFLIQLLNCTYLRKKQTFYTFQIIIKSNYGNKIENNQLVLCFYCFQRALQSSILIFKSSEQVESIREAEYNQMPSMRKCL